MAQAKDAGSGPVGNLGGGGTVQHSGKTEKLSGPGRYLDIGVYQPGESRLQEQALQSPPGMKKLRVF